jgi:SAM-dependent methyltransferase
MLIVDPEAAAHEIRRVLRPGGRAALAVWDVPERNPWATVPAKVMIERGHAAPPEPGAPGMFALAPEENLRGLLETSGFADVVVRPQRLVRRYSDPADYVEEHLRISPAHSEVHRRLPEQERAAVRDAITESLRPYTVDDGSVELPGSSLVTVASA